MNLSRAFPAAQSWIGILSYDVAWILSRSLRLGLVSTENLGCNIAYTTFNSLGKSGK